jgi:hypothetical protein
MEERGEPKRKDRFLEGRRMGQSADISDRKVIPFRKPSHSPKELLREVEELRARVKILEEAQAKGLEAQKALQNRLALEKFVAAISARFLNLSLEEIDREVESALRAVGEIPGVGGVLLLPSFARWEEDRKRLRLGSKGRFREGQDPP